jgi:hypothetical protein
MKETEVRQLIREEVRELLSESFTKKKLKMKDFGDALSVYGGGSWNSTCFLIIETSTQEMVTKLKKVVDYVSKITETGASRTFVVSVEDPTDEDEQETCEFDIDGDGADRVLSINMIKRDRINEDDE